MRKSSADKKNKRSGLSFGVYFAYLLVITLVLTSVTFSGYVTRTSGGDSARVATFELTADSTDDTTFNLDNSEAGTATAEYTFTVSSNSEVASVYDVEITMSTDLSNQVTMSILKTDGTPVNGECVSETNDGNSVYLFENVGEFSPSADVQNNSHTLTITLPDKTVQAYTETSKNVTNIRIIAEQID